MSENMDATLESGPDETLHMLARLLIDPHGAFLAVLIEHV